MLGVGPETGSETEVLVVTADPVGDVRQEECEDPLDQPPTSDPPCERHEDVRVLLLDNDRKGRGRGGSRGGLGLRLRRGGRSDGLGSRDDGGRRRLDGCDRLRGTVDNVHDLADLLVEGNGLVGERLLDPTGDHLGVGQCGCTVSIQLLAVAKQVGSALSPLVSHGGLTSDDGVDAFQVLGGHSLLLSLLGVRVSVEATCQDFRCELLRLFNLRRLAQVIPLTPVGLGTAKGHQILITRCCSLHQYEEVKNATCLVFSVVNLQGRTLQ